MEEIELSILMPCLNEAETLEACIQKALSFLRRSTIDGEIIVADNGSTDGSDGIALRAGVRLVKIAHTGYGSAIRGGIAAARGRFVIIGDADGSYDFSSLDGFMSALRGGADLVLGNRFRGGIAPGAMPIHHKYFGNPALSGLGNLFFRSKAKDFHCGLRGFRKAAIVSLELDTTGFEFSSEMIVKASLHGLEIEEVPTTLVPDGRGRRPHLRSWHDGWRNLRFLLLYSPRWLFFYPGLTLITIGLISMLLFLPGPVRVGNAILETNSLLYSGVSVLLGLQFVIFSVFTKIFGINAGLLPEDPRLDRLLAVFTLERGLICAASLLILGLLGTGYALNMWRAASFGPLDAVLVGRVTVPSVTALACGLQIGLSSFFVSILQIGRVSAKRFRRRRSSSGDPDRQRT